MPFSIVTQEANVTAWDTIYSYTQMDGIPGNGATLTGIAIDYQKNGYRLPTEAEWEYAAARELKPIGISIPRNQEIMHGLL